MLIKLSDICRMRIISNIVALFCLFVISACSPSLKSDTLKPEPQTYAPSNVIVDFDANISMDKINQVRRKHFLPEFRFDPRLMAAAERHAELMGSTGKFGHDFGPSTKFKKRIFAVGFENSAGENLGVGYQSIEAAIEGWLNSPGHRKILLKRNYSLGGIAYASNTSGKSPRLNHFWVLIVGAE